MICRTCGTDPCINSTFCANCRKADARRAAERRSGRFRVSAELIRAHRLLADDVTFERAYVEINDPHSRPTPQTTIEAVLYAVRRRSVPALKEANVLGLLKQCDPAARAQIDARITKLAEKGNDAA